MKKNIILKKFLLGNFFKNLLYEGVLGQVFHLNEDMIFYWNNDKYEVYNVNNKICVPYKKKIIFLKNMF